MNLSYAWTGGLIICLTIVINGCLGFNVLIETAPWIVNIQKYDLIDENASYKLHCIGALTGSSIVLTSSRCLDTLPVTSQMVLFAGNQHTNVYIYDIAQKFLPFEITSNNQVISITITPPMSGTSFVDYIKLCTELNCLFDGPDNYGFQYGYRLDPSYNNERKQLYVTQYNFSNSSALCQELIGNDDNKHCTYHDCALDNNNIGGEVLTKVHKGQLYLMGFWDYDVCDKNIRVFQKIGQDKLFPYHTRSSYRF